MALKQHRPILICHPLILICHLPSTVLIHLILKLLTCQCLSRRSSLTLALKRSIPYPVPSHILQACRRQSSFPGVIVPSCSICELCGSSLTTGQQHPGRALNDPSYILTPWSLTQVNVLVKFCSSKDCKAMHQAWPIDQGMCYRILSLCPMFFFLCYS